MEKGVAYQNKDIFFKILSENYKEKSFEAYGLNLPKIQQLLPTDLPKIMANDKRMDHLFLLEDGTLVIVDYESVYKKINKVKYLHYAARVLERYWNQEAEPIRLRILIIYTGDVEDAEETFHTDCVTLRTEQAFLVKIDGIQEMLLIQQKIQQKQKLSDYDIMKLMILPLTQKGSDKKQTMLNQVLELADEIMDEQQQLFALSGIVVACDKFITKNMLEEIRRRISLTKIGLLFEKEKMEYASKLAKEAKIEAEKSKAITVAEKMLKKGYDLSDIMEVTGLTEVEILLLDK